jgi:hypothetical protein
MELILAILTIMIFVFLIVWATRQDKKSRQEILNARQKVFSQRGYRETQSFTISDSDSYLGIDESSELICIIGGLKNNLDIVIFPFKSLVAVELVIDGDVISSTSRSSQIAGAALGDLLLGPIGLVVGGLSGKKNMRQQVSKMDLKLTFDDMARPVCIVKFIHTATPRGGPFFEGSLSNAERWLAIFSLIIRRFDREFQVQAQGVQHSSVAVSVADELVKLAGLVQKGLISNDEFNSQKQRLLTGGS